MIKTILVPLSGGDIDKAVLDAALAIARPWGSHIECYHHFAGGGEAIAYMPHTLHLMGAALRDAMDWAAKRGDTRAAASMRHFAEFCDAHAIPTDVVIPYGGISASISQGHHDPVENLCFHARHNDLVVMGRPKGLDGLPADLVQRILLACRQPLLLIPEHFTGKLLEVAMICWKDTVESARALTAALPVLKQTKQVILTNVDEGHGVDQASIQAVAKHLAWHGVQAQIKLPMNSGTSTMETLWSCARDWHAGMLVMGGYSRGPTRELLFGGCTDSALIWGELPVLITR